MYYYCNHCCVVFKLNKECPVCGKNKIKPIEINVQYHEQPHES
jgi:hypothetical protein